MKPLALPALVLILMVAAGCGRRDDLEHRVRQYDVVEERSADGVTTSLGGEQPGTVPTLTATNVDTTTDLSLIPGADTTMTSTAPPGSLAETLDIQPGAPAPRSVPPGEITRRAPAATAQRTSPAPPAQTPSRAPARQTPAREAPATEPAPEPQPQPAPEQQPPAEQTPPPTSTAPTTTQPETPPPTQTSPPPTQTNPDGRPRISSVLGVLGVLGVWGV